MRTLLLVTLFLVASQAMSEVVVSNAWVRLLPPGVSTTAGYMRVLSEEDDRLVGASSPEAAMVEIHESSMHDGVMQMSEVPRVPVPAGESVIFEPGGYHLMVMGLQRPLAAGRPFPLVLHFERAGRIETMAEVRR